jgi:hypothetical protein
MRYWYMAESDALLLLRTVGQVEAPSESPSGDSLSPAL